MAQRVIVFEKDASFVRELEEGFGRLGLTVETSRDAEAAIARVREGEVRLILISVDAMGTPGEAFLVCKRFKSDDDLAKVPLVIMGGAQHAESFESHKKLKKRRADEYVQLPATFSSLLSQIAPVTGLSESASGDDVPLDLEDDGVHFLEPEELEGGATRATPSQQSDMVQDEDIDAFADNAFGELLRDEDKPKPAAEPQFVAALRSESQAPEIDRAEMERLRDDAAIASRRASEAEQRLNEFSGQLTEGQRKLADAELRLSQAEARAQKAEADRIAAKTKQDESDLRAEAAERRLKEAAAAAPVAAPSAPGISSRDYLDLREQLNRKDKELLALRDEVTQRDRQLLDASDRSLSLERAQAELQDSVAAAQRQLEESQVKVKAYEVDREAVTKRLEDFRGRLARAEDKGKRVEDELEALKVSSGREVADLKAAHGQAISALEQTAASDAERLRTSHAATLSELEGRLSRELAEANSARENQLAALRAAQEKSASELRASHERELEDRRRAHEAEAEERRKAAEAALASALAEAASERSRALEALGNERTEELARRLADAERAKNAALAGLQRDFPAQWDPKLGIHVT